MPLHAIPIVHKFGIISQSHKRQLQQRLLQKKKELENELRSRKEQSEKHNIQITEEFVANYNQCGLTEKTNLDEKCHKMFEKIKRKLNTNIDIDDISLQIAWAELSQLVQCNSPVQEECMDLFISSLEKAHLSPSHVATLFFLAETVIYWLRMDTINQPFLRAIEIKLLKVGQLVFQRIYYHFLEGILDDKFELKEHLSVYLDGFEQSESVYAPYPDALLYMKYMTAVGDLLLLPLKEEEKIKKEISAGLVEKETDDELVISIKSEKKNDEITQKKILELPEIEGLKVHDLSPTLWHAVDLYICVFEKNVNSYIQDAALSLIECSLQINEEHWIDCIHAIYIIGECAKWNLKSLDTFLNIAEGKLPDLYNKSENWLNSELNSSFNLVKNIDDSGFKSWKWEIGCIYVEILTDIIINGSQSELKRKALLGTNKNADDALKRKLNNNRLTSFGLLDMARFYTGMTKSDEDWAWRIRYSAVKGLVRICKSLKGDNENVEIRKICWSSLVVCQETELNTDVLEAVKVGQVGTKDEEISTKQEKNKKLMQKNIKNLSERVINAHSQMAQRLGGLFISPLYDKNCLLKHQSHDFSKYSNDKSSSFDNVIKLVKKSAKSNTIKTTTLSQYNDDSSEMNKQLQNKKRTTLKEEIKIKKNYEPTIPNYSTRKNYDLMRIVEDQYRKQIKEEYEKQENEVS